jgi:hypothetical protein
MLKRQMGGPVLTLLDTILLDTALFVPCSVICVVPCSAISAQARPYGLYSYCAITMGMVARRAHAGLATIALHEE